MRLRHLYLLLAVAGTVLPYWQLIGWLADNGIDVPAFFDELTAGRISAFAWWDVLVSGAVLIVLVFATRERLGSRWWWPLPCFVVGVSLALPVYLYLREVAADTDRSADAVS